MKCWNWTVKVFKDIIKKQMKNQISPKIGILIIISLSFIILVVIGVNFLDFKFLSVDNKEQDFEVVDFLSDEIYCDILYDDIKILINENNFCKDSDECHFLTLDNKDINTNCYFYINKNIDKTVFHDKLLDYKKRCMKSIDNCSFSPNSVCIDGRCVSAESHQ